MRASAHARSRRSTSPTRSISTSARRIALRRACDAAGAIDFEREPLAASERFDLVLDLGTAPLIGLHQPPQGYFHAGDDEALVRAVLELRELVGEFEKPKFFHYKPKLCAHSRNERVGCSACIDVCSAQAITSDAKGSGGIIVNPMLCVGCASARRFARAVRWRTRRRPRPIWGSASARYSAPTCAPVVGCRRRAGLLVHSHGEGAG
jgi:ferredoxin